MDDVARWPNRDRTDLLSASAARRGVSAAIIEKDFWVCWTLPAEDREILPYAAEVHPEYFRAPSCRVHVLAASRTFCEKLTVLHACHHAPVSRPLRARQSRHYYGVARLYEAGIGKAALQEPDLLRVVAAHQAAFFRTGWAKYEEAVPGTLRLLPPDSRLAELEQDYEMMKEMIFGDPSSFARILEIVTEIERVANSAS
jgi:hypothetical protein